MSRRPYDDAAEPVASLLDAFDTIPGLMPLPSQVPSAQQIARQTPSDRDRIVDFVRVTAIAFVVVGHWLVGVIEVHDGVVEVRRVTAVIPAAQPLTWLFQVMPLFFMVGGAVNAGSWQRSHADPGGWAVWARRRARRLLRPLRGVLGLWLVLAAVLPHLGIGDDWVGAAVDNALLPIWFLAVYLLAIVLTPVTWRLHRRFGPAVLGVGAVLTAVVDTAHRGDIPVIGFANYLLVWGGAHQLGFFWHDGRLQTTARRGLVLATAGIGAFTALLTIFDYPIAMVAPGEGWADNTDPPTLAIWALMLIQVGVVVAVRRPLTRWLQRERVWAAVVRLGSLAMTIFLWHMTALVVVAALVYGTGLWSHSSPVDGTWWALRPVWLLACTLCLAGVVAVVRPRGQPATSASRPSEHGRPLLVAIATVTGIALTVVGLGVLLTGGVYDPASALRWPAPPVIAIAAGMALLGVLPVPVAGTPQQPPRTS